MKSEYIRVSVAREMLAVPFKNYNLAYSLLLFFLFQWTGKYCYLS